MLRQLLVVPTPHVRPGSGESARKAAHKSPETFVAIAAKVCPADVRVTLEQQLPSNLGMEDWTIMREIVAAVRQAIPDASNGPPAHCRGH